MSRRRPGEGAGEPRASVDGDLVQQLSRLARTLEAENDPDQVLAEIVSAATDLIPGVDDASLSVVTGRRSVTSHFPTSDLPQRVDALQDETGQGPCLDAVFEHETVRVPDMAREQRWPRFARAASAAGARSMLSFQLYVEGDNLGALNLYGHRPDAFDEESEHVGLLFASHAAVAMSDARKVEQLEQGMRGRDLIGQAKGILMERYSLSADQAFRVLVRFSQDNNRKLRDVADELATTRSLPDLPG